MNAKSINHEGALQPAAAASCTSPSIATITLYGHAKNPRPPLSGYDHRSMPTAVNQPRVASWIPEGECTRKAPPSQDPKIVRLLCVRRPGKPKEEGPLQLRVTSIGLRHIFVINRCGAPQLAASSAVCFLPHAVALFSLQLLLAIVTAGFDPLLAIVTAMLSKKNVAIIIINDARALPKPLRNLSACDVSPSSSLLMHKLFAKPLCQLYASAV